VPGYEYSAAMKKSGIVWNRKTLERFLADPTKTVPGTTMTYAGVPDAKERADLIAYLGKEDCK
jgi:cytochrome c